MSGGVRGRAGFADGTCAHEGGAVPLAKLRSGSETTKLKPEFSQLVESGSEPTIDVASAFRVDFFAGDLVSAAALLANRARSGRGGYACFAGVHGLVTSWHRRELGAALDSSWLNFPDGAPVAWMMRRAGMRTAQRLAGPDVMPRVFEAGQAIGLRHFLFGSTPQVLAGLERRLADRYPDAIIAGTLSPPFRVLSNREETVIIDEIMSCRPDLIWVGLGLPKQDEWMHRNVDRYEPALALGVGAAFDFLAGTKPRAPLWMQRHGLEWAHRLGSEPRRLTGRYLRANSEFTVRAVGELARVYASRFLEWSAFGGTRP